MASIEIKDGHLVVHIKGIDKLLALRSEVRVPLEHVVAAQAKVGSSRVDLQACKLEYSIVSPK